MSDYSPGPVQGDEILVRTLYSPVQINKETGEVTPANFQHEVSERGLSVNRKSHISEAELRAKIEAKITRDVKAGKNRDDFYKVVTARCCQIRRLVAESGQRHFCVYDTAKQDDISHADVCLALELPPGTPNRRSLRKRICSRLFEAFVGQRPAMDLATMYATED